MCSFIYPNSLLIGSHIREIRESLDLSALELSLQAGLDRTYLYAVERGKNNISVSLLSKICKVFGISLSTFFRDIESPQPACRPDTCVLIKHLPGLNHLIESAYDAGPRSQTNAESVLLSLQKRYTGAHTGTAAPNHMRPLPRDPRRTRFQI
jgi:transcriptional regulator with XRE-family HTH domain